MRFRFLLPLFLAGCATLPPADRVQDAERARFHALVQNDFASLAPLLAEDLVYVHSDGAVESKQQFLERVRSGALRYRSIAPSDVVVRFYGDVAIVTGRADVGVTQGGVDRDFPIRYTSAYRSTGGAWQLVSWQSVRLTTATSYLDSTGRPDALSGGARMIPIKTPKGTFNVWTKRVGNNPRIKVLLLHGGPAATHEYFEAFDSYFPAAGIEYYYYDQLGSFYSDQPNEPELWDTPRFVEEVEQVRQALVLNRDNFYLLGHSWGGILAIEYALKYGQNLKGLIISNMMSSIPKYNEYAEKVLMPAMDQAVLAEIKRLEATGQNENPRYMELLMPHHYEKHILRMPAAQWPDPVNRAFKHLNYSIYAPMQGPSELGASGKLEHWDRSADLSKITTPTLVIGARYDTMDPEHMKWMATALPHGRYLFCPNGTHLAMYDDQKTYFPGVIDFILDVDSRRF